MALRGKTALITGSTGGIGFGIARLLAGAGANIVLNGFGGDEEISRQKKAIEGLGVGVLYHGADMMRPETIEELGKAALSRFGRVDILVNNAGIQYVAPVDAFPPERWDAILATNLSAAFHTIRCFLPAMRENNWGRIINIASAHALVASPCKSAYVAAKHGVLGLTRTVALEVARQGITCNAVCPGYVYTPLVENQIADTAKARGLSQEAVVTDVLLAAQWTKRFVTIEEVAQMVLFLCSNAAGNITGSALPVDGGWTAS